MLAGPDLLVILVIALVIFGGNRIADLGAGLGKGIRSFNEGLEEKDTKTASRGSEDTSQKSKE
jgi:sec-independent protein translocase protein TatA